ncbi:MAG: four helix bundle protein [Planctomycetota bacterium]|nr:MAG: four helix bundle protein [Planctomycetota bacterium]
MRDEQSSVRSYRDLIVWQKSISLAETVYQVTQAFPREEVYGLTSQMRRAAVSVASNIAEGNARQSRGEYLQFLGNARGSLAELYTQATIAARLDLLRSDSEEQLVDQLDEIGRLLNALRSAIAAGQSSKRSDP